MVAIGLDGVAAVFVFIFVEMAVVVDGSCSVQVLWSMSWLLLVVERVVVSVTDRDDRCRFNVRFEEKTWKPNILGCGWASTDVVVVVVVSSGGGGGGDGGGDSSTVSTAISTFVDDDDDEKGGCGFESVASQASSLW